LADPAEAGARQGATEGGLNFEDERYVRIYTRKTVTTKLLGWDGRMCLHALLLEVDRAGILELEGLEPAEALAALADLPLEHARTGVAKLLERGVVTVHDRVLFVPNFIRAQEATQSDAQRQRESRARRAAAHRAGSLLDELVTERDDGSQGVTKSHAQSQHVTTGHSVLSRAVPANPAVLVGDRAQGRAPTATPADSEPAATETKLTTCPLDLLEKAESVGIVRDFVERYGVEPEQIRAGTREFVTHWTIGGGMGRRDANWFRKLRADLKFKCETPGKLKPIGELEHDAQTGGRQSRAAKSAKEAGAKAMALMREAQAIGGTK
jgi:hypothetical protein